MTEPRHRNLQTRLFLALQSERVLRWRIVLPLAWLSLSILAVGLVRSQEISVTVPNGAPVDETFHFGWVLDTVTALPQTGVGPDGHKLQSDFQQTHPDYLPKDPPQPYNIILDYWQGIGIYFIQALVQLVTPISSLAERLYLARFVNVCFAVVLAWMAYAATASVIRSQRIALVLAGLLSFIPTLGTSAATVTTEVPAFAACLALFIALAHLYKSGWSGKTILWLCIGCLGCLFTKVTSWPVIGVIAFMMLRRAGVPWRVFLLGILLAGVGAATQFQPQGAAHWYREYYPWEAWGVADARLAPVDNFTSQIGDNSLLLVETSAERPIVQHLPESSLDTLRGQTVTLGSWVRAAAGTSILLPVFQEAREGVPFAALPQAQTMITASGEWQFVQYRVSLPSELVYARIALWQIPGTETPVWYDGLVLVKGDFADGGLPQFDPGPAARGAWNGQPFVNLLQNGSVESQWWGVKLESWAIAIPVNLRLFAWQDGSRTWSAYLTAARAIFVTLWGSFQNDIPGLTRWQNALIGLALGIGLTGSLLGVLRQPRVQPLERLVPNWVLECWSVWVLVYVAIGLLRSDVSGGWASPFFYASGRFIIPSLFPLLGLTLTGLYGLLPRRRRGWVLAGLVAAMFLLNLWILMRVEWPYYHCATSPLWNCIAALY